MNVCAADIIHPHPPTVLLIGRRYHHQLSALHSSFYLSKDLVTFRFLCGTPLCCWFSFSVLVSCLVFSLSQDAKSVEKNFQIISILIFFNVLSFFLMRNTLESSEEITISGVRTVYLCNQLVLSRLLLSNVFGSGSVHVLRPPCFAVLYGFT